VQVTDHIPQAWAKSLSPEHHYVQLTGPTERHRHAHRHAHRRVADDNPEAWLNLGLVSTTLGRHHSGGSWVREVTAGMWAPLELQDHLDRRAWTTWTDRSNMQTHAVRTGLNELFMFVKLRQKVETSHLNPRLEESALGYEAYIG